MKRLLKRLMPSIIVQCCEEAKENTNKKGMECLNISEECKWFHIKLSIAVAILLILGYFGIRLIQVKTWVPALLWVVHGSTVALLLGHLGVTSFLKFIRKRIYQKTKERKEKVDDVYTESLAVPATVVGVIERIFFGVLVAFNIQAAGAAIGLWIVVKMATDWQRLLQEDKHKGGPLITVCVTELDAAKRLADQMPFVLESKNKIGPRSLAWASLLAGVISLLFAVIGGLICQKALDPYF